MCGLLHGLHKSEMIICHEKSDGGSVGAAAEAMIKLLGGAHGERRRLIYVKRTACTVVLTGLAQRHASDDERDHVAAAHEIVDEMLWYTAGHDREIVCLSARLRQPLSLTSPVASRQR